MRDRTIVAMALLFLILSVGLGVNMSLAAGSKMLGRQMAPSFEQIYNEQAPMVLSGIRQIAEKGKIKVLAVTRQCPVLAEEIKMLIVSIEQRIKAGVTYWRGKFSSHLTQKMIY